MSPNKFGNLAIATLFGLFAFPLFVLGLGMDELLVWPGTTLAGALFSFTVATPRDRDRSAGGTGRRMALAAALGAASGVVGFLLYEMSDVYTSRLPWALGSHLVGSLGAALVGGGVRGRRT